MNFPNWTETQLLNLSTYTGVCSSCGVFCDTVMPDVSGMRCLYCGKNCVEGSTTIKNLLTR